MGERYRHPESESENEQRDNAWPWDPVWHWQRESERQRRLRDGERWWLYHATTAENAESIERDGFKYGTSGFAGLGFYFADSPHEAIRNARVSGVDTVLQCEVLLGEIGVWRTPTGYDSVRIEERNVTVVFRGDQVETIINLNLCPCCFELERQGL